jgi:hypothetical protein
MGNYLLFNPPPFTYLFIHNSTTRISWSMLFKEIIATALSSCESEIDICLISQMQLMLGK